MIVDLRIYLTLGALAYAANLFSFVLGTREWRSLLWGGSILTLCLTVLVAYLDWLWS